MIKEHAVAVALAMRETGPGDNDLLDRLAADPRLGVDSADLERRSPIHWSWPALPGSRWLPWSPRWTR